MPILKADFHIHTGEDRQDPIPHTSKALIDRAALLGYEVIAITNHNDVTYTRELVSYAKDKGILLIPGCEALIEGKHVLLYNFPSGNERVETFDQIAQRKGKNNLVIAPHPFFPTSFSMKKTIERHLNVFDALEYCHYHHKRINFNKRAVSLSKKRAVPLVGTSDTHMLFQLGLTYSLVEAEKDMVSVFEAIKKGKVEIFTQSLTIRQMIRIRFGLRFQHIFRTDAGQPCLIPQSNSRLPSPVKLEAG